MKLSRRVFEKTPRGAISPTSLVLTHSEYLQMITPLLTHLQAWGTEDSKVPYQGKSGIKLKFGYYTVDLSLPFSPNSRKLAAMLIPLG